MKRSVLGVIAGLAILGLSTAASATVIDLGVIAPGGPNGASLFYADAGVAFSDTWTFRVPAELQVAIVVDSAEFARLFGIDSLTVSSADMAFHYVAADNSYRFLGVLPAGDYSFDVSGTTFGVHGAEYEVIVGGLRPR